MEFKDKYFKVAGVTLSRIDNGPRASGEYH